jgi:N6-adenosine-specific RNA methylase IME4
MELRNHPAADAFPMMDAKRYNELVEDIKNKGQLEEITLCDGMVLDGRNRLKACVELGIQPKTRNYSGDPWAYAWSLNGQRRDLADMQRAAIKIRCNQGSEEYAQREKARREAIKAEADKARSEAAKEQHQVSKPWKGEEMVVVHNELPPPIDKNKGRAARAKEANVSSSTQARVEALANNRPDLLEKVASGDMKGTEAMRQMKKDQVKDKVAELPPDKFSVIYADPPWKYGDTRNSETIGVTGVEHHYPTMSLSELKALEISALAADNCVLWLWATSPLLEDALELVKAWGFKYKAQFVWDKVGHNMGHYNSVRHELLFICTKGSATPENVKLFDSVQVIEKTKKHSEKPEEFRQIINTLYPSGKKIELFRRGEAPEGWQAWGNEVENG